ncbi:MAG: hypothetical protein ACP5QA_07935, partial [Phycisphaerae bacterium]
QCTSRAHHAQGPIEQTGDGGAAEQIRRAQKSGCRRNKVASVACFQAYVTRNCDLQFVMPRFYPRDQWKPRLLSGVQRD